MKKIRTTLNKDAIDWIDSHSNRRLSNCINNKAKNKDISILGQISSTDKRYKTYARNLLDTRKELGFDDSVCRKQ
tara:strand:+ start:1957 stop:2181 length:225 start_codon:yes stop_codon:yes gene_type:complete